MINRFTFIFILIIVLSSCKKENNKLIDYRQEMRDFVISLSKYARSENTDFIIVPQNGIELVSINITAEGNMAVNYIDAISGCGQEDLFYGYNNDNNPTPQDELKYLLSFLDLYQQNHLPVLITDYCWDSFNINQSYTLNDEHNFISFAAPERGLNVIPAYPPEPYHINNYDILSLSSARNFLYLINPEHYQTRNDLIHDLSQTNYDLLIIDLFFNEEVLSHENISSLKIKKDGGDRLVICYMSIGEAEDYRYYWQEEWNMSPPSWLDKENPDWSGNYKVRYWKEEWKKIIFGSQEAYFDKIIAAGFDGVYLDIIDAFEYFE